MDRSCDFLMQSSQGPSVGWLCGTQLRVSHTHVRGRGCDPVQCGGDSGMHPHAVRAGCFYYKQLNRGLYSLGEHSATSETQDS